MTTAQHNLGEFVVRFQGLERGVNGLIKMLSRSDENIVDILINDLEFSRRIKTLDVLYFYYVSVYTNNDEQLAKNKHKEFHRFIVLLQRLAERRNSLVHSKYTYWQDVTGSDGLIRNNYILRGKDGEREEEDEELQPEAFDKDFTNLDEASEKMEFHRSEILDWQYPDE